MNKLLTLKEIYTEVDDYINLLIRLDNGYLDETDYHSFDNIVNSLRYYCENER